MVPIVDGLEREFAGRAAVLQLDASEADNAQLLQQYGLRGHPSFVVLDGNGRPVQTFVGPQVETALREAITAVADSSE